VPLLNPTRLLSFLRSSRDLRLVLLAVVVGLAGGAGAIVFRTMIGWARSLFFSGSLEIAPFLGDYRVILLPAIGLVLVSVIVRRWAPEARGHGVPEVQYAVRRRGGRIRPRVVAIKALASALCIGSGGSVGREGPIVQIGSAVGSAVGTAMGLRADSVRLLLACGAAAGIGGTFNAPIAGVMFAMEVILGNFTARSFGLVVLASVSSTALVQAILGKEPAFALHEVFTLVSPLELPLYLGLGIIAGALSALYVRTLYGLERAFGLWRARFWLKALAGGLVVGVIGYLGIRYLGGDHLFGVGYEGIEQALALGKGSGSAGGGEMTVAVLLILVGLKLLATSTTLAAGGSGGVFAPALYMGAMLGGAFGLTVNGMLPSLTAPAGAYCLVGMGAVFAGAAHAPISSILILFEMTDDYQIILPLMLAVVISYLISSWLNPDSIYDTKLRHLGGMSPIQAARGSVLDLVRVIDAMTPELQPVHPDEPVMQLVPRFRDQHVRGFPVLDTDGSFVGLVTATDVQNALIDGEAERLSARDVMTAYAVTCTPEESLREVLQRIRDQEVGQVPVVDKTDPRRLLGLLQRNQILWAIGEMASEHSDLLGRSSTLAEDRAGSSLEILVEVRSSHRGISFRRLRQLDLPEQCLVTTLRRGDHTMIPNGNTVIEPGDLLTVVTTPSNEPQLREWVNQLDRR